MTRSLTADANQAPRARRRLCLTVLVYSTVGHGMHPCLIAKMGIMEPETGNMGKADDGGRLRFEEEKSRILSVFI